MREIFSWKIIAILTAYFAAHYFPIFLGSDFFVDEDPFYIYSYTKLNDIQTGWRPDKMLGQSFFYGDPAAHHAWSLFTLLEQLPLGGHLVYDITIMGLMLLTVSCVYYFFCRVQIDLPKYQLALLANFIAFGALQYEFFFQRSWIALTFCTPILMLLLDSHILQPKRINYLYFGLLTWASLFLGCTPATMHLVVVIGLFAILYYIYEKPDFIKYAKSMALVISISTAVTLALGAWVFYSIYVESSVSTFHRSPKYFSENWFSLSGLLDYLWRFQHATLKPAALNLVRNFPPLVTLSNVSPLFPAILLIYVIPLKSASKWDFILKGLLYLLMLNEFLNSAFPVYTNIHQGIFNLYPIHKFQPVYHFLQLYFLARFISDFISGKASIGRIKKKILLAFTLFYGIFVIANAMILQLNDNNIGWLADHTADFLQGIQRIHDITSAAGVDTKFIVHLLTYEMRQLSNGYGWTTLIAFSLTAWILIAIYLSKMKKIIPFLFALNMLFFANGFYPLNDKPTMVWSQQTMAEFQKSLKPYDRFIEYRNLSHNITIKDFDEAYPPGMFGFPISKGVSALDLSSVTSFVEKDTSDYLQAVYKKSSHEISSLRDITQGGTNLNCMGLDWAAVKYYYSLNQIKNPPPNLVLKANHDNLFVYENTRSWPYYFLAQDVVQGDILAQDTVEFKRAYTPFPSFPVRPEEAKCDLRDFKFGELKFSYESKFENLLVVADAWHPMWKCFMSDGKSLEVLRANGPFKAIRLPPGQYSFVLLFDSSPYNKGIWISLFSLLLIVVLICYFSTLDKNDPRGKAENQTRSPRKV